MSLWFAPAPSVPPAPVLGPSLADWRPPKAGSVVWFCVAADFGLLGLALVAARLYGFAAVPLALAVLAALAWAQVRRTFLAVGEDWLYVRSRLPGDSWTYFSGLESGAVTGKGGTTLLLRGPSFSGRVPVREASTRHPTAFHRELARRVLARQPELTSQARFVLYAWAGMVAACQWPSCGPRWWPTESPHPSR